MSRVLRCREPQYSQPQHPSSPCHLQVESLRLLPEMLADPRPSLCIPACPTLQIIAIQEGKTVSLRGMKGLMFSMRTVDIVSFRPFFWSHLVSAMSLRNRTGIETLLSTLGFRSSYDLLGQGLLTRTEHVDGPPPLTILCLQQVALFRKTLVPLVGCTTNDHNTTMVRSLLRNDITRRLSKI